MPDKNHDLNRAAWNEMAEVHFRHPDYRVKEFLEGASTLKSIEQDELGNVSGISLLHLFCQFGLDTLSWARLGADVTGVDISDRSIELANQLKSQSGIEADFVLSDVLQLGDKIDRTFDIVFQSYGTHHWISDLPKWADIVNQHLKPGGVFYMIDLHPIMVPWSFPDVSYFNPGPYHYQGETDYVDKDYQRKSETVEWQHTLTDILTSLLNAGLRLRFLHEFDSCCYPREKDWIEKNGYFYPPDGPPRYPMMFSLYMSK